MKARSIVENRLRTLDFALVLTRSLLKRHIKRIRTPAQANRFHLSALFETKRLTIVVGRGTNHFVDFEVGRKRLLVLGAHVTIAVGTR